MSIDIELDVVWSGEFFLGGREVEFRWMDVVGRLEEGITSRVG